MKNRILLGLLAYTLMGQPAIADDAVLIRDLESLKDSLPFKDPGRPLLTRRLADVCFEKAMVDDKNYILTGVGDPARIRELRKKAYQLYQEALDGNRGVFAELTGSLRARIRYQMARLKKIDGDQQSAIRILSELVESESPEKEIKREVLLTLAEIHDENGAYAPALKAYQEALPLCEGHDSVSYVKYRLAWSYFRTKEFQKARAEMAQALWDGNGGPKEQAFSDYIQFLAVETSTGGQEELGLIEPLVKKSGIPNLVEDLGEAFFAAGNREAGVLVIAHAQRLKPSLYYSARLAEEYYGFRDWDRLRSELSAMKTLGSQLSTLTEKQQTAVDQILRRLVVQIDGERKSNPGEYFQEALVTIDLHLTLFPASDVAQKMREGWLAAQPDEAKKLSRLALWTTDAEKVQDQDRERQWRQARAAIALQLKDLSVVISEAHALAALSLEPATQREWEYVEGKALLDSGKDLEALSIFQKIASPKSAGPNPDKWAIQAQHLALAVLNKQKRYFELAAQAQLWTANQDYQLNNSLKKELTLIAQVGDEARFEAAAGLGETPEALESFKRFCLERQFMEKSCPNARVLATKLGRRADLIEVLRAMDEQTALSMELERSGRFLDVARIKEEQLKGAREELRFIEVATLYLIGGDETGVTRVYRALAAQLKKNRKISPELEPALISSFQRVGFTAGEVLSLPWTLPSRLKLAATYEDHGLGNEKTRKILASATQDLGPTWAAIMLERSEALDKKQRSFGFYGKRSGSLFPKRLQLMGAFAEETKKIVKAAQPALRVYLLDRLARAYQDLDQEILSTPIPDGLGEEEIQEVRVALDSLAAPLRSEGQAFEQLRDEQSALLGESAADWKSAIDAGKEAFLAKLKSPDNLGPAASELSSEERAACIAKLFLNPTDSSALRKLREDHAAKGEIEGVAYFTGRISDLEKNL